MRLSNGIAKLENGVAAVANWLSIKAADTKASVEDKFSDLRTTYQAAQLAELRSKLSTMPPLDRQEIELRASEITMIKDATAVLRAERALRRQYAKKVLRGEIALDRLVMPPEQQP